MQSTPSITKSVCVVTSRRLARDFSTHKFSLLGLDLPWFALPACGLTCLNLTQPSTEPNVTKHELTEPELPGCDLHIHIHRHDPQSGYVCSTSSWCIKCNSPLKRPRIFFWFNNFLWLSFYMQQHSKLKLNDRLQLHSIKLYILHRWIKVPIAEVHAQLESFLKVGWS